MNRTTIRAVLAFSITSALGAQEQFAAGLQFPQRLLFTPAGSLLVSEGGTPQPNSGRVSILDRQGNRRSLLEGLPSGLAHPNNPLGPTGMAVDGNTLYLLIGEGDITIDRWPEPFYAFNPNGPSSPLFSSVLRFDFSRPIDQIQDTFRMELVHHWGLIDGHEVYLASSAGEHAVVQMLTAFRQIHRNVLGGEHPIRPANPMSVLLDASRRYLYVTDASAETISRIDTSTGRAVTLFRFEPQMRSTGPDDIVPTGICWSGENIVVGNLSAGPFPEGDASLRIFNPSTRQMQSLASGFAFVTDVACGRSASGPFNVAVAEFSLDLTQPAPTGRVKLYDGRTSRILGSGFAPTGIAFEPRTGDVYVALFGGRILRFASQ